MVWVVDCEYVVEREEGHWTISNQGRHFGHFADRRGALRSAASEAARVRRLGHRVLVRRADGRLRAVPAHAAELPHRRVRSDDPAPRPKT
jgi:hypothetical protein